MMIQREIHFTFVSWHAFMDGKEISWFLMAFPVCSPLIYTYYLVTPLLHVAQTLWFMHSVEDYDGTSPLLYDIRRMST